MIEKEALILSSLWHRDRLVIQSPEIDRANNLFLNIKYLIPQYRHLLLCGTIPKQARYINNARLLGTKDLGALKEAFQQSFAEEEMGISPLQIIYFHAGERAFGDLLKHLDRGWIATTTCDRHALEKEFLYPTEEIVSGDEAVFLIDPKGNDISLEERIIEDTIHTSGRGKEFMIQMKQSEVHLAFQAILDEVESGKCVTQSYLAEAYGLKEKTLKKIIEIGKRERRTDLSPYIKETSPRIINFFKEISSINEISLAAIFDNGNLVGYAKYRDIAFPTANFLRISERLDGPLESHSHNGQLQYIEMTTAHKDIFIYKNKYLYGFILEKGVKSAFFRFKAEKLIKCLHTL